MFYQNVFRLSSLVFGIVAVICALLWSLGQNGWQTPPVVVLAMTLVIAGRYLLLLLDFPKVLGLLLPLLLMAAVVIFGICVPTFSTTIGTMGFSIVAAIAAILIVFQAFTGDKDSL